MKINLIEIVQSLKNLNSTEVDNALDSLFKSEYRINIPFLQSLGPQHLWRVVRIESKGEKVADFGYPPKPEYCSLGRCNRVQQQVFYGGVSLGTCINEIKDIQNGERIRVGQWRVNPGYTYFKTNLNSSDSLESRIYSEITSLFAHEGSEFYEQTSSITNWLFNQDFGPFSLSGIGYPSTLKTKKGEYLTNFAFKKEFTDSGYMSLEAWYQYEVVEKRDGSYILREIFRGGDKNGLSNLNDTLLWTETPDDKAFIPPMTSVMFKWDGKFWVPDKELPGNYSTRQIES